MVFYQNIGTSIIVDCTYFMIYQFIHWRYSIRRKQSTIEVIARFGMWSTKSKDRDVHNVR